MLNYFKTFVLIFVTTTLFNANALAEKYTILVEPDYPDYQIQAVYEPLKKWLISNTGYDIEIKSDINYHFYWVNAQGDDKPDFTLDASHIGLYRNLVKNYTPLLTTIEPLEYHLVSLDEPGKNTIEDFVFSSKPIALLPRPSISVELFHQWFDDKLYIPKKNVTSVTWQDTIDMLFDGAATAAIIPNKLKDLYPNLLTLSKSKKIQGPTFMAAPHVPQKVVNKFKLAILSMNNNPRAFNVLSELNTEGFMPVDPINFLSIQNKFPFVFNESQDQNNASLAAE